MGSAESHTYFPQSRGKWQPVIMANRVRPWANFSRSAFIPAPSTMDSVNPNREAQTHRDFLFSEAARLNLEADAKRRQRELTEWIDRRSAERTKRLGERMTKKFDGVSITEIKNLRNQRKQELKKAAEERQLKKAADEKLAELRKNKELEAAVAAAKERERKRGVSAVPGRSEMLQFIKRNLNMTEPKSQEPRPKKAKTQPKKEAPSKPQAKRLLRAPEAMESLAEYQRRFALASDAYERNIMEIRNDRSLSLEEKRAKEDAATKLAGIHAGRLQEKIEELEAMQPSEAQKMALRTQQLWEMDDVATFDEVFDPDAPDAPKPEKPQTRPVHPADRAFVPEKEAKGKAGNVAAIIKTAITEGHQLRTTAGPLKRAAPVAPLDKVNLAVNVSLPPQQLTAPVDPDWEARVFLKKPRVRTRR